MHFWYDLRLLRVTSVLVLFFMLPQSTGLDFVSQAMALPSEPDPEQTAYELSSNGQMHDLAEEKHFSALELLEWVRQEIEYEPYAGSRKGAVGTFFSRGGNDLDQAVLLGSLLDLANVKWRLAFGDVRLPSAEAARWLGVSSPVQAVEVLSTGGVPHRITGNPSNPTHVTLDDHAWVEIFTDFLPMRGAAADDVTTGTLAANPDPAEMWISVDPSITLAVPGPGFRSLPGLFGVDSAWFLGVIEDQSETTEPVPGGPLKEVDSLPDEAIVARAVAAGKTLKSFLKNSGKSAGEEFAVPTKAALETRPALPGNLPYEVLGDVTFIDHDDAPRLAKFLASKRHYVTLRFSSDALPGWNDSVRVGMPRIASSGLSIHFEVADSSQEASLLETYGNNSTQIVKNLATLRPVVSLGANQLLSAAATFGLGAPLKLTIEPSTGQKPETVGLIAGGFYEFVGFRTFSASEQPDRQARLANISGRIGNEFGFLSGVTHEEILSQYLQLAAQTMLYQGDRFSRLGLSSLGYRTAGPSPSLLAGLEPTFVGDTLTTSSLVVHSIGRVERPAPKIATPAASRSEAQDFVALARDAALTAPMAPLSGHDRHQSATRLLAVASEEDLKNRTLAQNQDASSLSGLVPAGLTSTADELVQKAGRGHLVMPDDDLYGMPAVGLNNSPADWGYWFAAGDAAHGRVTHRGDWLVSAYTPLGTLYPLDTVLDASKGRYQTLTVSALAWNDAALGISGALEMGATAAAGLSYKWLDSSQSAPKAVSIPAAAIALHGALANFAIPQIESIEVAPEYINTVATTGNPEETSIDIDVTTSNLADTLWVAFENELGESEFVAVSETGHDERDFEITYPFGGSPPAEGLHYVRAWTETLSGAVSEEARDSYIVDNTPPAVAIEEPALGTKTGRFTVKGSITDANLASWTLDWREAGQSEWATLRTGDREIPLVTPLFTVDSRELGWSGDIEFRISATDKAANSGETMETVNFFNDVTPPAIGIGAVFGNGGQWSGEEAFSVSVSETPESENTGIKWVKFWLESEQPAGEGFTPFYQLFVDKEFPKTPNPTYFVTPNLDNGTWFLFNSSSVRRAFPGETFRFVAEAEDWAGNIGRDEITGITIGDPLWYFDAIPRVLRPGNGRTIQLGGAFETEPEEWDLTIEGFFGAPVRSWTHTDVANPSAFGVAWDGTDASGQTVAPGIYYARLAYQIQGQAEQLSNYIALRIVSNTAHNPKVVQLQAQSPDGTPDPDENNTIDPSAGISGRSFIATGQYPIVEIDADIGASMQPFLVSGGRPREPSWNLPYNDAYWAIEYKSSMAYPKRGDMGLDPYRSLTDRTHWQPLAWGFDYPTDGIAAAELDTRSLSEGYYDVRIWVTDGVNINHFIVFYMKVVRNEDTPPTGTSNDIGALTLSATDMVVPFSGFTAEISRSYNSKDIYSPGPLGYGWRLNSIALQVEPITEQGAGEFSEAMIRLADGRKFFFANNPLPSGNITASALNSWAAKGEYIQRPYGMRLFRPGGSLQYHWPHAEVIASLTPQNVHERLPKLGPGQPNRQMQITYTSPDDRTYHAGDVAYLQTEDKTWYIFEWQTGDMLEIIHPSGQVTTFEKQSQANIVVSDFAGREVTVNRDISTGRIHTLTDPTGYTVRYEYDAYGNLIAVTDRSGRKRFYLYDTPETKERFPDREDLTGENLHYLVDVRVDDDADGIAKFEGDTIPETEDARLQGNQMAYQNYPGDVSIMSVKYDANGLMVGVESPGGGAAIDHNPNDDGPGGTEVVRDEQTNAETIVAYDGQNRVTEVTDAYNNTTTYTYGESGNVSGVLTQEQNALGHVTQYEYPPIPTPGYSSFSDMFESYLDFKLGSDEEQQGYLTGAQSQPSVITQELNGQTVETQIAYNLLPDSPAAFKPTQVTDPSGNVTGLNYDSATGELLSVSYLAGGTNPGPEVENDYYEPGETNLIYGGTIAADSSAIKRLRRTITRPDPADPNNEKITSYGYQFTFEDGKLVREQHAVRDETTGLTSYTTYDANGKLLFSIDARGRISSSTSDGEGRGLSSEDDQGNKNFSDYDVYGRAWRQRRSKPPVPGQPPASTTTEYTYDDVGRVIKTINKASNGQVLSTSSMRYEESSEGRIETSTDSFGLSSSSFYDAGGRLIRTESYDVTGRMLAWTTYEYDALGRNYKNQTSQGLTTTQEYDDLGRAIRSTVSGDGYNLVTEYGYDIAGRQLWTKGPDGEITSNQYDDFGRLWKIYYNDTVNVSTGEPDYASGVFREFKYDGEGRRTHEIDEAGKATKYRYDDKGRVDKHWIGFVEGSNPGLEFTFGYDDFGNRTSFTNPLGRDRLSFYDARGRLKRETSALGDAQSAHPGKRRVVEYTYNDLNQLIKKTEGVVDNGDPENGAIEQSRWTAFKYDPYTDQLKEKILSDGKRYVYIPHAVHYSLTDRVEVYQPEGEGETLAYWRQNTYNPLTWRLASTTTPEGTIWYGYTDDSRLKRTTTSTGLDVHYTHDALGNLKTVASKQLSASGTEMKVVTYFYDAATGRRTRVENPNGTSTDYEYHDRGWTSRITHKRGSTVLLDLDYTRDDRGLITQTIETRENQPQVTWTYIYDDARRLIDATRVTDGVDTEEFDYSYDDAGNRLTKFEGGVTTTYTYNSLDQMVSDGTTTYGYDVYGNLKREAIGESTKREFTWDSENHLIGVEHHDSDWTLTFNYDHEGTRIRRKLDTEPATQFLVDYNNPTGHSQVLSEIEDGAAAPFRRHIYGTSVIAEQNAAAGPAISHGDNLGTPRLLTNSIGQSINNSAYDYAPFGMPLEGSHSSLSAYRFTGQWTDLDARLQYHRARWFDPSAATWISVDPNHDFPSNFANPYSYVGASPLSNSDPSGLSSTQELSVTQGSLSQVVAAGWRGLLDLYKNKIIKSIATGLVNRLTTAFFIYHAAPLADQYDRLAHLMRNASLDISSWAKEKADHMRMQIAFKTILAVNAPFLVHTPVWGLLRALTITNIIHSILEIGRQVVAYWHILEKVVEVLFTDRHIIRVHLDWNNFGRLIFDIMVNNLKAEAFEDLNDFIEAAQQQNYGRMKVEYYSILDTLKKYAIVEEVEFNPPWGETQ